MYKIAYENKFLIKKEKTVTKQNFVYALKAALNRAFTKERVMSAFTSTGNFPPIPEVLYLSQFLSESTPDTLETEPHPGRCSA